MKTAKGRGIAGSGGFNYPKAKFLFCLTAGFWVLLGTILSPTRLEAVTCNPAEQIHDVKIKSNNFDHVVLSPSCTSPVATTFQMVYLAYGPSGSPTECGDNWQSRIATLPLQLSGDTVVGGMAHPMIPLWQGVCQQIYLVALGNSSGCDANGHCSFNFAFGNSDGTPWVGPEGPEVFDPGLGTGNVFNYTFELYSGATSGGSAPTITSVTPPNGPLASGANITIQANDPQGDNFTISYAWCETSACQTNFGSGNFQPGPGPQTQTFNPFPAVSGSYTLTITAEDTAHHQATPVVRTYQLTVGGVPVINSALTASVQAGSAFSYQITATNNPTSFIVSGLPSGLSVNPAGLISGTPPGGTYSVSLSATNGAGTGPVATLILSVTTDDGGGGPQPPVQPPVINSDLTANGVTGTAFAYRITATNSPTNFNATGLPSGLSINTGTGRITGTPTAAGTFNVTISAANSAGSDSDTLVITISFNSPIGPGVLVPPPTASSLTATWTLPNEAVVSAQTLQIKATNVAGATVGTSQTIPQPISLNPTISVNALPLANASYNLVLQHIDLNNPTALNYLNSQVAGITLAQAPAAPVMANGGTVGNIYFVVNIPPDTNTPPNSTDSKYAILITLPDGNTSGYLDNKVGGSNVSDLKPSPVWKTAAEWNSANNFNRFLNPDLNTTYQAQLVILQNYDQQQLYSQKTTLLSPGRVVMTNFNSFPKGGYVYDNVLFGIAKTSTIHIWFNSPLDTTSLNSKITVTSGVGNNATTIPATVSYSEDNSIPSVIISYNWVPGQAYYVSIAAGLKDKFSFTSTSAINQWIVINPEPGAPATIISPLDTERTTTVRGTVPDSGKFIVPRVAFINPTRPLIQAAPSALSITLQGTLRVLSVAEVDLMDPDAVGISATVIGNIPTPVDITMKVPSINANVLKTIQPSTLQIYTLSLNGRLVPVKGTVLNPDGSLTAHNITQSGLYFIAGAIPTQLGGAFAYPVPFRPASGHTVITFANLATDTTIKIYTIMGELVKQIDPSAVDPGTLKATWPVKNTDGENVASGVYIFQIKNSYSEKRGKLVIIR